MGHPKMPSGADTVNLHPGNCVSMSSTKDTALACIINSEVGAVLAVMRRNVRWADHYLASNDQREHPLIQSLMTLRRQLFSWHHRWRDIDPCIYLEPFLDIIQSGETSAPITGVALSSVYKVLILDMIDEGTHNAQNAQNAMQLVVDAVTSCRFEVTDPASEEVVLMKILQVLLACMKCKGSVLLSNKHVFTVVNTCFSIVHQAGSKGELLQRIARSTMHELVRSIFAHLQDLDKTMKHEAVGVHTENGYEGKLPSNGSNGLSSSGSLISDSSKISAVQTMDGNTTKDGDLSDAISSQLPIERDQYGIPCMVDILHLFASLLNAVEHIGMGPGANSIAFDEDVPMFALGLINSAVELGGASFRYHPTLLSLVKDELFLNILQYGLSMSPLVLSMVFNIILSLYCHVGTKIKLQLEAFFSCVILKLTQENIDSSYPQQEVALEALVDFCRQKGLMVEMYVNLDCDMTCSNVFENVVDVLARRANPEDGPLSSIHMLALDGLTAIITGMIERIGNGGTSSRNALSNLEEYMPIWKIKCENYDDPDHWVPFLQWRKQLKKTLMMGVDQFNRDSDLGFEFFQKAHLLPEKLDPDSVACLFRYAPGLDKNIIGDYLGSHDLFCIQTLHAFAGTFDFQDMSLDTALRLFLETFRLPGESQKIQRILEAFSERYFVQSPNILANKDAALLLSYSLIMLNTDQHNTQVKKKMTEEEFIRNNRHINGGSDLPREYLSELYHSICKNEISFTGKSESSAEMTPSHWIELIDKSKRADPFIVSDSKPYLDRDMFSIMAGPTIAAITAVFDLAEDDDIYQRCIDGFLDVAKVAASHHLEDVLDNVVVSLCRFTVLFNLSSFEEPVLGEDMKARMAIETIFKIANLYGDSIRISWRSIIDCILKLHKLGLLPAHMASEAVVESDPKLDSQTLISPAKPPPVDTQKRPSSGLISKFSQLFSFDIDEPISDPTEQELAAHKQALEIIESCHVDTIFAESKFLQAESLLQLSQALIWVSDQYQKANGFPAEEDTGTFCLELLITITLNNRDRIGLLWQCVYEHIAKIVQSISIPCALVEKAVFGLLRICQRLLPYKETLSDELLKSLQLVLKLDARVADTYCEQITREIGCLVKSSAAHIKSQTGWRAIVSLLSITARHPEASEPGFDALFFIMSDGAHLLPVNYLLCVDASRQFAESRVGGSDRSLLALDVMSGSIDCLSNWAHEAEKMNESDAAKLGQDIGEMWLRLVQGLRRLCSDQREDVRNHAVLSLQNCLIGADKIRLSHSTWSQCFESAIFVMLDELVEIAEGRSHKDYRNMEGTLVLALKLLSRVFLQMLNELSGVEGFDKVWVEVLNRMEKCMNVKLKGRKSERVRELVPELLKNTLLVMKARGVLVGGGSLWDTTWTHVNKIVPSLQSELFKEQEMEQKQQEGRTGEGLVSNEMSPVPS